MLQRVLARENVDERRRGLFRASGIATQRQLLQRPLWDVAHAVDMSVQETEELIEKLSIRLAPAPQNAFDMFLESANHPTFLRTGLPNIDQALNGGLQCRALSEFVGSDGIGKSQVTMTLAVLCAMDYPENTVVYFDVEHNFSAKRLLQIAIARIRVANAGLKADINALAAAVLKRIRIVKVDSLTSFLSKFKELEGAMPSQAAKLVLIDCVSTLFIKADNLTLAQRQHQMLKVARDLKLFADTYQAFVAVTNRASIVDSDEGFYTRPLLGDTWAHCVTTRFVLERYVSHCAMTIVKSSAAGYAVQPFTITEGGIEAAEEPKASQEHADDFAIHDKLLSDLALGALPMVDPASTVRSTQQSSAEEDPDATQLVDGSSDEEKHTASSFDLVSDSNSDEDDSAYWELIGQ